MDSAVLEIVSTTARRLRLRVGQLWIDCLTFNEALAEIERLVEARDGGFVFTPNVDHVVMAETTRQSRKSGFTASPRPFTRQSRSGSAPLSISLQAESAGAQGGSRRQDSNGR